MRCIKQCCARETYPKLHQYPLLLVAVSVIHDQPYLSQLEAGSRTTGSLDSCTMPGYHFLHKTPRMLAGVRTEVPDKTNQALHK